MIIYKLAQNDRINIISLLFSMFYYLFGTKEGSSCCS